MTGEDENQENPVSLIVRPQCPKNCSDAVEVDAEDEPL
jgi:hypothetical protein